MSLQSRPSSSSSATGTYILHIKPYTPGDLSLLYGVSRKVILQWLLPFRKKIGDRIGRFYTVAQIEIIFECIGKPPYQLVEH